MSQPFQSPNAETRKTAHWTNRHQGDKTSNELFNLVHHKSTLTRLSIALEEKLNKPKPSQLGKTKAPHQFCTDHITIVFAHALGLRPVRCLSANYSRIEDKSHVSSVKIPHAQRHLVRMLHLLIKGSLVYHESDGTKKRLLHKI